MEVQWLFDGCHVTDTFIWTIFVPSLCLRCASFPLPLCFHCASIVPSLCNYSTTSLPPTSNDGNSSVTHLPSVAIQMSENWSVGGWREAQELSSSYTNMHFLKIGSHPILWWHNCYTKDAVMPKEGITTIEQLLDIHSATVLQPSCLPWATVGQLFSLASFKQLLQNVLGVPKTFGCPWHSWTSSVLPVKTIGNYSVSCEHPMAIWCILQEAQWLPSSVKRV